MNSWPNDLAEAVYLKNSALIIAVVAMNHWRIPALGTGTEQIEKQEVDMKFVRLGQILAVAAGFITVAVCPTESQGANSWTGYLVDAKSAESFRTQAHHGSEHSFVTQYSRDAAVNEESIKAGYMIHSGHHWYRLDEHGNSLAVKALKRSIKKNGFLVHVSGNLKGDILETEYLVEMVGGPHQDTTKPRAK